MATLNMAAGAVLEAASDVAISVGNLTKSVSTGALMLNDFISDQRQKAAETRAVDAVFRDETLLNTKMLEIVQLREKSREYMAGNSSRQQDCQEVMNKLKEALAAVRAA